MESIINSVCLLLLMIMVSAVYLIVVGRVLPKYIMKIRYTVKESRDRGLNRYTYPGGRGVVYEPHPSIRKYVSQYLLFTNDGYKYIKCRVDNGVRKLNYSVVMFNNQNKVIDVMDVNERIAEKGESSAVLIHPDTSYAMLMLNSVNGENIKNPQILCYRFLDIGIYMSAVSLASFAELTFIFTSVNTVCKWLFNTPLTQNVTVAMFILPAFAVGCVAGALAYLYARGKGVRWVK